MRRRWVGSTPHHLGAYLFFDHELNGDPRRKARREHGRIPSPQDRT